MITITLLEIKPGMTCKIQSLTLSSDIRRRLMDLGFISGESIKCVGKSPLGDPKAYLVKNSVIAIRNSEAKKINVCL